MTLLGALAALLLATQAACSDDDADGAQGATDRSAPTTGERTRPAGPRAELAGPLTAGKGVDLVSTKPVDLAAAGWVEEELTASGTATSYRAVGELLQDGRFELEPDSTAAYTTRVVLRRPADPASFNGSVVVEWLNVSGGLDAAPDFAYLADELLRGGYAWVGVSVQHVGIEGGEGPVSVAGAPSGGLRAGDPERYGSLRHPGDAFAYDIYTQVGRALRDPGTVDALGGLRAERLLAVGESQSAFMLTTYVNGVQPISRVYDGFLIHSRGGAAAPLGAPGAAIDMAATRAGAPTRLRTDGDVPILVLETETDVLGLLQYFPARQPDGEHLRVWEVAGTAHADAYLLGPVAGLFDCGAPINAGPQHFIAKAALRHLDTWVRGGDVPPSAPPLEVDDSGPEPRYVRDDDGNVLGGIRTPHVDVPVATLSGEPSSADSVICLLLGSTIDLSPERLAAKYATADAYLGAFEQAADAAIEAGFVLAEDRAALLAEARSDVVEASRAGPR